jgi:hypothetical protein
MKPRHVKVPAARFFEVGIRASSSMASYYHQLALHLESATVWCHMWEGVKRSDGAEVAAAAAAAAAAAMTRTHWSRKRVRTL